MVHESKSMNTYVYNPLPEGAAAPPGVCAYFLISMITNIRRITLAANNTASAAVMAGFVFPLTALYVW